MTWRVVYLDGMPGAASKEFPTKELAYAFAKTLGTYQLLSIGPKLEPKE